MNQEKKTVLVVDDEGDVRLIIKTLLNKQGYMVDEAENGEEALRKLSSTQYDLMILDIMMPDVDGFDVLDKANTAPPVIMLTAKLDINSVCGAYQRGATVYIPKPFDHNFLVDVANYIIGDISSEERSRIERTRFNQSGWVKV